MPLMIERRNNKTVKELIEDIQKDEALAAKFNEAIKAKAQDVGKEDPFGAIAEAAAEAF